MAKQRYVNTRFWDDNYIINLSPDEKVLFLYFLTSPLSNIAGVYECPVKIIGAHTGLDRDILPGMIGRFEGKIHYIDGWIYIRNFIRHQSTTSKTVKKGIDIAMEAVPPRIKKKILEIEEQYRSEDEGLTLFSLEGLEEELEEQADEEEKFKASIDSITKHYQDKIKASSLVTKNVREKVKTRLKEFTVEQLKQGIDNFANDDWRMRNNADKGMVWFFNSDAQVLKWIELSPVKKETNQSIKI